MLSFDIGRADTEPGTWRPMPSATVEGDETSFCIRVIPIEIEDRITKNYGHEESLPDPSTGRRTPQRIFTQDEQRQVVHDKAEFAWIDVRNLQIRPRDEDGAREVSNVLGEKIEVGQTVVLDGRLNKGVKRLLFRKDPTLPIWILKQEAELSKTASHRELSLGKAF